MSTNNPYEYYHSPPFNEFTYSIIVQIYFIFIGTLSVIGNFYLIILFVLFGKLRQLQSNWFIIFLCTSYVFVGIGTVLRGLTFMVAIDHLIVYIPFYACSLITFPFAIGYRTGQAIALMIALDQFIAVWKPFSYNKLQKSIILIICGAISLIIASLIIFIIFFGTDPNTPETLDKCTNPISAIYYKILPSYSGIISIFFFGFYFSSVVILFRYLYATKKKQGHMQNKISKVQQKVSITVSCALLCYSIFYGIPTIMYMLCYYFNITGWIKNGSTSLINYGVPFNGCLNVLIYVIKHQEFRNCSKLFIIKCAGRINSSNIIHVVQEKNLFQKPNINIVNN